jgi:hypothetical protein
MILTFTLLPDRERRESANCERAMHCQICVFLIYICHYHSFELVLLSPGFEKSCDFCCWTYDLRGGVGGLELLLMARLWGWGEDRFCK